MNAQLKRYLKAVTELLKAGGDLKDVLKNTRSVMGKRGHAKLYPALLHALHRVYPSAVKSMGTRVVVAKESDLSRYRKQFSEKDVQITIDPTIVGGYIETKDFVREDHSYKTKLLTWYRRATAGE